MSYKLRVTALFFFFVILFPPVTGIAEESLEERINTRVYRTASPAVVNITTTTLVRDFFSVYPQKGAGSGSIIDGKGYIITNHHVVDGASEIIVTLTDGSRHKATLTGADPENDIAIIKINVSSRLPTIKLGDSSNLQVGQRVFAIGNPFGLNSTLTTGIISAVGRPLSTQRGTVIENVIQTDAPINPGNSGGPLLNTRGEMIGINTAIFTPSGGSVGIGFAIPVNTARAIIPDLIAYGKVRKPWVGITGVSLWPKLAEALELPVSKGIMVSEVVKGSPAERAGIRGGKKPVRISDAVIYVGGDIITHIDGREVNTMADVSKVISKKSPGDKVNVVIIRDKKTLSLDLTLRYKP